MADEQVMSGQLTVEQMAVEQQASLDIATALRALTQEDRRAFGVASARVTHRPEVAAWRGTTERLLVGYLQSAVSGAWQLGWQPADLVRLVSRRLSNRHVDLARVAVAAEMQRYAPATIDPRWTSELADLEAQVWWRADQNLL